MMIPSFLKQILYLNFLRQLGEGQAIKNFFFLFCLFFSFFQYPKKSIFWEKVYLLPLWGKDELHFPVNLRCTYAEGTQ